MDVEQDPFLSIEDDDQGRYACECGCVGFYIDSTHTLQCIACNYRITIEEVFRASNETNPELN